MPYIEDKYGNRFLLGIHRGIVVDRDDKSDISDSPHRGRIQVKIPFLDEENAWPRWCDAAFPSHQFFSVPAVGTVVYVMFNGGNPEQPVWIGAADTTNAVKDPPSRFRRDNPDVSGYESLNGGAKGHVWEFNDIAGERRIYFEDINNNYQEFDTEENDWNIFFAHDENREIQNDVNDTIGNDENRTIGNDRNQDVGNDEHLTVANDQTEDIGNDRTVTVENNDDLTVTTGDKSETVETGNKTTDVETGSWINMVKKEYELTGDDRAKFEFQDKIEVITEDNLEFTVTGEWKADVTDKVDWTFSDDWTVAITGKTEFTGDDDFKFEASSTKKLTLKNTIFEFEIGAATSTWKTASGTASISITPASISITVGSSSWTMTSSGVVFSGSNYVLSGIDHITHRHFTFGTPPFTSTPQP